MLFSQYDSEILLALYLDGLEINGRSKCSHCIAGGGLEYARLVDEGLVEAANGGDSMMVGLTEQGRKVVEEALHLGDTARIH
jgi:hypothetical protein